MGWRYHHGLSSQVRTPTGKGSMEGKIPFLPSIKDRSCSSLLSGIPNKIYLKNEYIYKVPQKARTRSDALVEITSQPSPQMLEIGGTYYVTQR